MTTAILLSGGLDSIALAAWKRPQVAFTVDYGQRAAMGEIRAAKQVSVELGLTHEIIRVDCSSLGSGDMAGTAAASIAPVSEWWPYRNQLLLTLAGMRAVALGIDVLLIGSVKGDGLHADGTPQFYHAVDKVMAMQEGSIHVCAPALEMTSAELIRTSGATLPLLGWSHSCHREEFACGRCRGCYKHRAVLHELGYGDSNAGIPSAAEG